MYYLISDEMRDTEIDTNEFYGEEDEHCIYQWVPIYQLEELELYPEVLKKRLQNIPQGTEHMINKENVLL